MLGVAALPALVRFVAFFFLPESPRWLMGVGKVAKARRILQRLRGEENVEVELQEIGEDIEQSSRANKQSELLKVVLLNCTSSSLVWSSN